MPYIVIGGVLHHYGIPNMRWGHRRFQNKDGSLTEAGKRRYAKTVRRYSKKHGWREGGQAVAEDVASKGVLNSMKDDIIAASDALRRSRELYEMKSTNVFEKQLAYREFASASKRITDSLVGTYGHKRVFRHPRGGIDVNDIIGFIVTNIEETPLADLVYD